MKKWDKVAAALCAGVLLAFFCFSAGVHWDSTRWNTASRVAVERNDAPAVAVGAENTVETEAPVETERPTETKDTAETEPPTESEPVPVETATAGKVNINTADKETLMTLPGIGEARAQAILDDREANGPFRHPEDITRVRGIGEKMLEEMLDQITTESEEES
jgi:comEA protein